MAFYTLAQWRVTLQGFLPNGANLSVTVMNEGLRNAVAYCGTWARDIQRLDLVGDGVTSRFALPGADVELAPADQQETPTLLNTSGIATPTTAASLSASGTGSTFVVGGLYYGTYSASTARGETPIVQPYQSVRITSGQNIVFAALSLPTNVTGINYYVSKSALDPDIQLAGTGAGALKTITAPPITTSQRPFADYQPLIATYAPIRDLEQDIAVDGTPSVGNACLTLTAAPALGDRFRVVYTRAPALPITDTDIIRVPEQMFREAAIAMCAKAYAFLHESGDSTAWLSLFDRSDAFLQDIQKKDLPRLRPRPRIVAET